nr:hypothetical protein [Providencia sp. PROV083]
MSWTDPKKTNDSAAPKITRLFTVADTPAAEPMHRTSLARAHGQLLDRIMMAKWGRD